MDGRKFCSVCLGGGSVSDETDLSRFKIWWNVSIKKKRNVEDTGKKMSSQHSEAPEKAGGTTLMKKELVASFSQKERRKG